MKKVIPASLLVFVISIFITNAQSMYNDSTIDTFISSSPIPKKTETHYTGSPYISEAFEKGDIEFNGVKIAHNIGLRYNAYKDYFEIKKNITLNDNQAQLLVRTHDISIELNKNTFVYISPSSENIARGYFMVLKKGENVSLYKKIAKNYIPGQKAYSSMTRAVNPMYKEKATLYLYDKDGILTELSSSKKKKIKAFKKHQKEIKAFVKENGLNINKEKDLIKLIEYFNSL